MCVSKSLCSYFCNRIVLLRDPWGHTNWKGTGHQWMEAEEGTFWIASSDLFKQVAITTHCVIRNKLDIFLK